MPSPRFATVLVLLLGLAACGFAPKGPTRVQISAETLPWVDMSTYRTWAWWRGALESRPDAGTDEALLDWRVRQDVAQNLAARGYRESVYGERPDFIMVYDVSRDVASTSSFRDYLTYRADGGSEDMGEAFMGYQEGQLVLRAIDAASKRVAWRGRATAILEGRVQPDLIDRAVADLLAKFPARPGS
ncbi:MAG: DUF4136 domain-containing protein [bacterium]|nr:DUF4136 domain-containing protein [bacterium]